MIQPARNRRTDLLDEHEVNIQFTDGGLVTIDRL